MYSKTGDVHDCRCVICNLWVTSLFQMPQVAFNYLQMQGPILKWFKFYMNKNVFFITSSCSSSKSHNKQIPHNKKTRTTWQSLQVVGCKYSIYYLSTRYLDCKINLLLLDIYGEKVGMYWIRTHKITILVSSGSVK